MPWPKGKPRSLETIAKIAAKHKGKKHSEEAKNRISLSAKKRYEDPLQRQKTSNALKGMKQSADHKKALALVAVFNFQGGQTAKDFADVLCPVGFVREHRIALEGQKHYRLDFAHVEAKVCIELDGPFHKTKPEDDLTRDTYLKSLGWKVIRIKHD